MNIAMLLSGGVDSSVAMNLLLQEKKHDITAFYLKVWLEDELAFIGDCPWEEDIQFAREVCEKAGVKLEIIPLQTGYRERIVSYVLDELRAGRTPSPDVFCNRRIKLDEFRKRISSSFERIATGHYAVHEEYPDYSLLKSSPDPVKDQTYFLSYLTQEQLRGALFPIGGYKKAEVRKLAGEMNLPTGNRKDSQGICFLGKVSFPDFIRYHLGEKKGDIIDINTSGVVGEHNGYWYYTIGQRRGLGLGGGPWYVCDKDVKNNRIFVCRADRAPEYRRNSFRVDSLNWIYRSPLNGNCDQAWLSVKIRHGPVKHECEVKTLSSGILEVNMKDTDQGVAPGQIAVFYDEDICLGGGTIQ